MGNHFRSWASVPLRLTPRRFSTARVYPRQNKMREPEYDDTFRYTSGRWLYNESQRLEERFLRFDIKALIDAAASAIDRNKTDVRSIRKLAEGGFNRIFELTMKDGFQLIARLPYPSTQPKELAIASEVATTDLVREHGVPVPAIYDYSSSAHNPVGVEYVLMEKVSGIPLGDVWFTMTEKERLRVLSQIADYEAKLFAIDLPAFGSVFYNRDLPLYMEREDFPSQKGINAMCIGPDISLKFWFQEPRTPVEALQAVASKEIAWLQEYGEPRLPYDRVYRDITNYEKSDPKEHLQDLETYKQIAEKLVPREAWLSKPTLRHPDLNPNNIFISKDMNIEGIIDWQHSNALPLFLQAGIPNHLQNYGDPDSDNLNQPQLPHDIDEMEEDDREKELELYRRRHVHFYYIGATAKKNVGHFNAMMRDKGLFRRRIFQHAGEPWEGNNLPLKADLINMSRSWGEFETDITENRYLSCRIPFSEQVVKETMEGVIKQEEAERQVGILRNALGISVDGWVSYEDFDEAVVRAAEMKVQALSYAESEFEREMTLRHWPFDDYDEKA